MCRFSLQPAPLKGLSVLQRHLIRDQRGSLDRLLCLDELKPLLGERTIVQVNYTVTAKSGTIRGMHFQYPPHAEMKLVTCLHGEIFDVAVDLRTGSPTFLNWHGEHLSANSHRTLAIPEGFAHGFQTLTDHCELLYLHTAAYQPDAEGGLDALDPVLAIRWPLPVSERSARDQAHAPITAAFA
ncbi:MAG: dTDP-4-dehydrorhamnose 3,5-epimerase family protein, partial [Thiohalocapsa sp.]